MEMSFKGKRALVTGGSRGIGRGISIALAKCGAETVAIGTSQTHLDSLKAECENITTKIVDLSNWDESRAAIESLGQFDLLVNSAGISKLDKFLEVKPEDFDSVINVNVKALINVSQVVAKGIMKSDKGGAIVNLSSVASFRGLENHTVYCASKGAVDAITKVMALELGSKIRVNSINPTVTMTDMGKKAWGDPKVADPVLNRIPTGRFVEVDDVVNAVLFLLSDQAAMLNGVHLPLDGGLTIH
ncbi:hypothetical protein LOTGIDRAFT_149387 [Lottia gigantea]|uniref:Ketoreductase domain-containing protein n=1 Tax=Lottia gigantea TaxID=225164 RepID=V3ZWT8_LOTGI|nr:hypothetical protein LOTGIDRAFT_149387 [Lottia gigantea]ESO87090.1 hypothetical protein LOTGIDRAFT_149387 [Lottia gigantea]